MKTYAFGGEPTRTSSCSLLLDSPWHKDWPNNNIPPHVDLPYDRDSQLPQAPEA